eukprot:Tbor_TRINITY_DN5003_c0_g1::TRINITY_DN5003_c0_g1_i1::g.13974::m.13974/K01230/MAN1; mannosyl-oligosaccharide alpha-1,2-mannosidase
MGFTYSPNSDPANSYVIMKSDDLNNVNMNNNNIQKAVNSIISSFELNVDYALNPHSKNKRKDETYIQRIINRNSEIANAKRREAIIEATLHSWNGYKTFALGHDDFRPQTKTPNNWNNEPGQENGVGMTLIDAVTTLQVMGLDDEVAIALDYIRDKLHFSVDVVLTVFEANIRLLGGLLSIYELTGEKHKFILDRAKELGDILLKSFDTSSGIPHGSINLKSGDHFYQPWDGGSSGLAEIGTLQLEFRTLSYHTKDPIYDMKVTHITSILDARAPSDYMCPIRIHGSTTEWMSDRVNMGAMGDSFFEYLIKQYVLTNNTEERYANMSRKMISGVSKLLFRSKSKWLYIAQYTPNSFIHKMDHVTCFMGGNIALSSQELPDLTDGEREDMLKAAGELTETCVQFYKKQKTGLSPEIVGFGRKKEFGVDTSHYILRPETVESLFYMWRYTRDQKWRDYGWDIFRAIDKYCRVESGGYAGARDVNLVPPELDNTMPSFWLAETMKYMYLLFADDSVLDLRQWVFNTEAHPLRRRTRDPMDLWRQYETEHGHVPWFPPPVSGVVPIETEIMTKMRINGTARKIMAKLYKNNPILMTRYRKKYKEAITNTWNGVVRKGTMQV